MRLSPKSLGQGTGHAISLLLVRRVAPTAAAATTSVPSPGREAAAAAEPSSAAAEAAAAATTAHAGNVGALRRHLDVAALEDAFVEDEGLRDEAGFREFDVGISATARLAQRHSGRAGSRSAIFATAEYVIHLPLWLSRELVQEYRHSVDGTAALEMRLNLFGRRGVVDVADKDAARVHRLLVVGEAGRLLLQAGLHLPELVCLLFHLSYATLHGRNFFLSEMKRAA